MNLAYLILKTLAHRAEMFEESTKDPVIAQKKVLFEYLERNKNTEYGGLYKFADIRSIADYQDIVPMSDCDSLKGRIERMAGGEENVLTADRPIFFGLTSGTTARQKFIPVTKYSRDKKAAVSDLWAYYIVRDHPDILKGKILAVVNTDVEGYTDAGIPYGAESGHGYRSLSFVVRHLYALPWQVFDIPDYEARYYCILRIGMEQNITTLATLNPSTIVLLCQKVSAWQEMIINDIDLGTIDTSFKVPEDIRNKISKILKPNRRRADELRGILKDKGGLLPKDFWPDMQLIECWKGGTVKLYLKELPKYFGDIPVRDFGCLSTEARSSIPMSDCGAGGVLAINTNFYEFIPKEDINKEDKRFLLCDQLEKGREYFLIVTTPGGLFRYNIDDIVTVDGFFNKTPLIEFVQKGLNAVSVVGEKLYESQVNEAVVKASEDHGLLIEFFSACAEAGNSPRYVFLVEFNEDPGRDKKKALLEAIEKELCDRNNEYEYCRKSQILGSPVLKVVRRSEFEKYRARKVSEGIRDSQFKAPELTADADFQKNFNIEEVINL
jgi:hypothetical protein